MSKFEEQQTDRKVEREHAFQMNKMRREKISTQYFDLAKIFCAGLVVGNLSSWFTKEDLTSFNYISIIMGTLVTIAFFILGYRTLNKKI